MRARKGRAAFAVAGLALWLLALGSAGCPDDAEQCDNTACDDACSAAGYPSGACSLGACQCISPADGDADADADGHGDGGADADSDADADGLPDGEADADPCVPEAETCNGEDDDCDGIADNEPDASGSCGPGDACVEGVCGPVDGAVHLAANFASTCAAHGDGRAFCWGLDLGDDWTDCSPTTLVPRQVTGLVDAVAVEQTLSFGCALRASGSAVCWGFGGLLGDGTETSSASPVGVRGLTDGLDLDVGLGHTCALRQTGAIACWGFNLRGEVGNGTTTRQTSPATVTGISDAVEVRVGSSAAFTCARLATGRLSCWGDNFSGQLGNGGTGESSVPVEVDGISDAVDLAVGGSHACAALADGTVRCWGWNAAGQLGNASTSSSSLPVEVMGLTDVVQVAAGGQHTCALSASGEVRCWGLNDHGQLGDGTFTGRTIPGEPIVGVEAPTALSLGMTHSCALRVGGTLSCWGSNGCAELGDGSLTDQLEPVEVSLP